MVLLAVQGEDFSLLQGVDGVQVAGTGAIEDETNSLMAGQGTGIANGYLSFG